MLVQRSSPGWLPVATLRLHTHRAAENAAWNTSMARHFAMAYGSPAMPGCTEGMLVRGRVHHRAPATPGRCWDRRLNAWLHKSLSTLVQTATAILVTGADTIATTSASVNTRSFSTRMWLNSRAWIGSGAQSRQRQARRSCGRDVAAMAAVAVVLAVQAAPPGHGCWSSARTTRSSS